MLIDIIHLENYNAVQKSYKKGEVIFKEDEYAKNYYQIVKGCVKMYNTNDDGKKYYQGIFESGEAFGEAPFYLMKQYPATAVCDSDSEIIFINKLHFDKLIKDHPHYIHKFIESICKKLISKSAITKLLALTNAEDKLICFLNLQKKNPEGDNEPRELVEYTRQEIADFLGLRVETVIRSLKKMEKSGKVSIINKKLYY